MQYFKGDLEELKMVGAAAETLETISSNLTEYFNDVYNCVPLGEFIFDEKRVPLTNAIKRSIFITSFKQIFEAWSFCGTAEAYILVFKKIFGEDVEIEFTVPGPGQLTIDIASSGVQIDNFIAREIVSNSYVFHNIVDEDGNQIVFSSVKGFETEHELITMLFSMVPNGIYTEVSLTLG